MNFHGLFIGVDRYASPLISDLSCSARDAQALYGLFVDTFGEASSTLLINTLASRQNIVDALERLGSVGEEDFVFIHFSGHGSDTHHLITHDTDPISLDSTAIHLQELVDLFARIPARNLLLCLDCCFAGGAGAKVFHAPVALRDPASAEALLQHIGGSGRVIFTAAGADQEAIEDRRRGHGIFSYYLLQAIQGAPEVVDSGAVPYFRLAQFVTMAVEAAAAQMRHVQRPALRGTIDGEIRLPILSPGAIYRGFFPDAPAGIVSENLDELRQFGFPAELVHALQAAIPNLNSLQQDAINRMGLFAGDHLIVSAPTSSGKTMIGELAALRAYLRGERSYVLLPLRALVNDKYQDLRTKYAALGIRVIRSTGEIADENDSLMRGKFDIALLTYERFTALAVAAPFVMRNVGLVVVDEVQMITDEGRGANLEFLLTLMRAQRAVGIEPQLVALSAVIGDLQGFDRWLGARLLASTQRPVPLEEGTITLTGDFHFLDVDGTEQRVQRYVTPEFRKGSSQDVIIPLVRQLVKAGEKLIVFRETKPIVRSTGAYLAKSLGLPSADSVLAAMPAGDPSAASGQLRECLRGGVAFHNADLERGEREAIEASFRDPNGEVKVLVATTTLAMGVNTPAWSVIIEGLEHPGGTPYTVAEYKNMVGRAGRLGWTPTGKAFLIAAGSGDEHRLWHSYVCGHPESLKSRFAAQDLSSAVCRVLATANATKVAGLTEQEIVDFLRSTFAAYQTGTSWSAEQIKAAVARLASAGLVETFDGALRLTALGAVAGELGIQVESVVRVARALRGLPLAGLRPETIVAATQVTTELDEIFMPTHKKSIKERQRWQAVPHQQHLPNSVASEIRNGADPDVTARCKRLASALMWIQGVELEKLEASLLIHLPGENAAGPIRSVAERTRDLIGVVARVAAILGGVDNATDDAALWSTVDGLSVQLELGIPRDLVWLASDIKRDLDRGEYLSLHRANLREAATIANTNVEDLVQHIRVKKTRERVIDVAKQFIKATTDADSLPMPAAPTD